MRIDLGTATDLGAVGLYGANAATQQELFTVFLSQDGTTWTQAAVDFAAANTSSATNAALDFSNSGLAERTQFQLGYDADQTKNGVVLGDGVTTFQQTCFVTPLSTNFAYIAFASTQNARYIKFVTYGNNSAGNPTFSNIAELAAFGPNTIVG
jgi:type V secretory pathway adhesin AidA